MNYSSNEALVVGTISAWGESFVSSLGQSGAIEPVFEASVDTFCETPGITLKPMVVLVENHPDSRQVIAKMRGAGLRFYLIWFGREFDKEDLAFGLQHRAYGVLENPHPEDPQVLVLFRQIFQNQERSEHFLRLLHSIKSLLLQAEGDQHMGPLAEEIKSAVLKLERTGSQNELTGVADEPGIQEGKLPFHTAQTFGDAMSSVYDLDRTGTLWVRSKKAGVEGRVEFLQGKIVAAISGATRGLKSIYRMFLWEDPSFVFNRRAPQDCLIDEHINESMSYICSEGAEWRRRFESIKREVPPPELVLQLEPNSLSVGTQLTHSEFFTLASVIEFGRVAEVLDYNTLPDVAIYESLIRLRRASLIRVLK